VRNLCVCQWGHSRSVALSRVFHSRREEAVAVGVSGARSSFNILCAWADRIFILQPHFMEYIPTEYRNKVAIFDVGPDRWVNPYNKELEKILNDMLDSWLKNGSDFCTTR
jgi:hypothetical protein